MGFWRRSWCFELFILVQYVGHRYIKVPMYREFWKLRTLLFLLCENHIINHLWFFLMSSRYFWSLNCPEHKVSSKKPWKWHIIYFFAPKKNNVLHFHNQRYIDSYMYYTMYSIYSSYLQNSSSYILQSHQYDT